MILNVAFSHNFFCVSKCHLELLYFFKHQLLLKRLNSQHSSICLNGEKVTKIKKKVKTETLSDDPFDEEEGDESNKENSIQLE